MFINYIINNMSSHFAIPPSHFPLVFSHTFLFLLNMKYSTMKDQAIIFMQDILNTIDVAFKKIEAEEEANYIRINIESEEAGLLIGPSGQHLSDLQHLLVKMLWKSNPDNEKSFIVDIDHYKKKQEKSVIDLATRKIQKLQETNTAQILPPMSPYYRKIIHLHIANNEELGDISTASVGNEPYRQIKIMFKNMENNEE